MRISCHRSPETPRRDVDLAQGIITVHQGKFRKDRLVPPALPVVNRLRKYAAQFDNRPPNAIFFPGPSGGPFSLRTVYTVFRKLLLHCGNSSRRTRQGATGFTTIVTYLPSTPYDAGIGAVRIWMPNFLFIATYLGHQNLPEHSVTCI